MPKGIPPPKKIVAAKGTKGPIKKAKKAKKTSLQLQEEAEEADLVQYRLERDLRDDDRILQFLPDEEIKEDEGADALRALRAQSQRQEMLLLRQETLIQTLVKEQEVQRQALVNAAANNSASQSLLVETQKIMGDMINEERAARIAERTEFTNQVNRQFGMESHHRKNLGRKLQRTANELWALGYCSTNRISVEQEGSQVSRCPHCLDDFPSDGEIQFMVALPCDHGLCHDCAMDYLYRGMPSCPLCRAALPLFTTDFGRDTPNQLEYALSEEAQELAEAIRLTVLEDQRIAAAAALQIIPRRVVVARGAPLVRSIVMNGRRVHIYSDANSVRSENSVSTDQEEGAEDQEEDE